MTTIQKPVGIVKATNPPVPHTGGGHHSTKIEQKLQSREPLHRPHYENTPNPPFQCNERIAKFDVCGTRRSMGPSIQSFRVPLVGRPSGTEVLGAASSHSGKITEPRESIRTRPTSDPSPPGLALGYLGKIKLLVQTTGKETEETTVTKRGDKDPHHESRQTEIKLGFLLLIGHMTPVIGRQE